MKKDYPVEFVYQALSLIVALIVVHAFYVAMVRPRASRKRRSSVRRIS